MILMFPCLMVCVGGVAAILAHKQGVKKRKLISSVVWILPYVF